MRYLKIYILALVIITFISCVSSSPNLEPIERVQYQMGTYARVLIYGGNDRDVDAAFAKIKELDNLLSGYNPKSEISEINNMAGERAVRVNPQVIQILQIAKTIATETDGVFDPTIGALTIGVYRFGRESEVEPDIADIDKAKSLVNYNDLVIEGDNVYLKNKGMMIDLGAIGKGYAVEQAVSVLKARGVKTGVVSLSGDLKVFGDEAEIAITNPENKGAIATFTTKTEDLAISTSGSYERSVTIDGDVYHHLIVPESGKPGNDFISLTVVLEDSSTLADAYATALFIMGRDKALEFLDNHREIGVFIVFPDKNTYYNETFSDLVTNLHVLANSSQ
ncbi:MAG: FAD:protein FMN transferase [Thermodesulfobacteriales bacterium]|nr:MAG: FAD:protein FMN transferase [Thermodesulfobacteriales bacterium]